MGIPVDISPTNFLGIFSANEPVGRLVLESLLSYDLQSGQLVPALAADWQWSDDRRSLVVTLRDDVTFHSGRDFGPEDVMFSVQAATAEGSGSQAGAQLSLATEVTATGDHEVTFTFDDPIGEYFLDAFMVMSIVDSESFDGLRDGTSVVGTGPFVWESWTPGSTLQLERNADYWQDDKPLVDIVTLRVIGQSQAMLAALRSGQISIAHRLVPRDVKSLESDQHYAVTTSDAFEEVYLGVDVTVPPFDDIRARQALAWALDRDRVVEQVYAGFAEATALPFATTVPGMSTDLDPYSYDAGRARDLLREAGGEGARVTLAVLASDPILSAARDVVQFNLSEIGLEVEPVTWDAAEVPERLRTGTTGGLWINRVATGLSPASIAQTLLPYRPDQNASNLQDPDYDAIVEAAAAAAEEAEVAAANTQLTSYVLEQAFHLTLAHAKNPLVTTADVEGAQLDAYGYLDLTSTALTS